MEYRIPAHAAIAERYAGEPCTLDNRPAKIVGQLLRFPRVATLDCACECEISWELVERVMSTTRQFRSTY